MRLLWVAVASVALCGCEFVLDPYAKLDGGAGETTGSVASSASASSGSGTTSAGSTSGSSTASATSSTTTGTASSSSGTVGSTGSTGSGTTSGTSGSGSGTTGGATRVAVAIAVGSDFACAVEDGGQTWCWGNPALGRLGGTTGTAPLPPFATQATAVTSIAAGDAHACVTANGKVYCWGDNTYGQVSPTVGSSFSSPQQIMDPDGGSLNTNGFTQLAAGARHTCLNRVTDLVCWGSNQYGELGGNAASPTGPVITLEPSGIASIGAGFGFTCEEVQGSSGSEIDCFGNNGSGQLALGPNGPPTSPRSPVLFADAGPFTTSNPVGLMAGGTKHLCIVDDDTAPECAGSNAAGQLGSNFTSTNYLQPIEAPPSTIGLAAGDAHTCALVTGGTVECWGDNDAGQLGVAVPGGFDQRSPVNLNGVSFTAIAAHDRNTCGLTTDGRVFCWGDNSKGQLGVVGAGPGPLEVLPF